MKKYKIVEFDNGFNKYYVLYWRIFFRWSHFGIRFENLEDAESVKRQLLGMEGKKEIT